MEQPPEGDSDDVLFTNNLAFHMEMVRLTGNSKLSEMVESLLYLLVRPLISMRYASYEKYAARIMDSGNSLTPEHKAIVDALMARDAVRAKTLLREDIYPAQY